MDFTDAHKRMVRDLYFDTERRANKRMADSPEYDIQQVISDFYQDWFRNTNFEVWRERAGRFDIVIYEKGKEQIYYEVKTYFKTNEKIARTALLKDVNKLADKLVKEGGNRKAYMLIVGWNPKLQNNDIPELVDLHMQNDRNFYLISEQPYIRLRPSRKVIGGLKAFVMSWEVLVGTKSLKSPAG